VADTVVAAASARGPVTRSVPRIGGLIRLARLRPVGMVLDVVFGRFGPVIARRVADLVAQQTEGVPLR
jgi:hypothetical protein